jgi:hypothetical protein
MQQDEVADVPPVDPRLDQIDAVAGQSPCDPNSLPHSGISYLDGLEEPPRRLRVVYSPTLGYARVAREAPFLIPGDLPSSGMRGQEKRRHLLDYIRMHLEELRPDGTPLSGQRGSKAGSRGRRKDG